MPYLMLLVNVQILEETEFTREFSKASAELLGEPEAGITAHITYNRTGPAGSVAFGLMIAGVDNLDSEAKEQVKISFRKFFTRKFVVAKDRVYIHFHEPAYT
ncbi:hypothetical protein K438DRAFT_1830534 [Mycena galopus ATCC 62051]|nr:hypothetical protein K438DRAFT_1830534 [Mycena galopus ATCC 62051]